jgi:hypothetical protein
LGRSVGDQTKASPTNIFNAADVAASQTGAVRLNKDEAKLFDVSKVFNISGNGDLDLFFKNPDSSNTFNMAIEVKLIHSGGIETRIIDGWNCSCQPTQDSIPAGMPDGNNVFTIPRLIQSIIGGTIISPANISQLELKIFGGDLLMGMQTRDNAVALVDTGETTIESIGTFGQVKRKLQAKIDRTSGTLIGIFDFALFSQTGI